ncbi:MAG TPA: hypothetical protein ENK23_04570, partial [Sorangium sp.]|nr:hypothetical protein [Sorangium sp.]
MKAAVVATSGCFLLVAVACATGSPVTDDGGSGAGGGVASGAGGGLAGAGGVGGTECSKPDDCPALETTCGVRTCDAGTCAIDSVAAGTPCSEMGGAVCNGMGTCVACINGADCAAGVCVDNECLAPACDDAVANGTETDVDCGGPDCAPCNNGQQCMSGSDCSSAF